MKIKKRISLVNFTDRNDTGRIKFLVIHYFGILSSAEAIANSWYSVYRGASAHYAVDETDIYQIVEDEDIAWHCGGRGIGALRGICTNTNSIGIEVRPSKIDVSTVKSASSTDWFFKDTTMSNLVELTKSLMEKYDIPIENVVRHFDVSSKMCPRPFMGGDINIYYGKTGNQLWNEFKAKLIEEEEDMTGKEIFAKLNEYFSTQPVPEWAKRELQEAIDAGITDGTNPMVLIPRYQAAIMAKRAKLG